MATATVDQYNDDGTTARSAGEALNVNGATFTQRTDTRWHATAPASMVGTYSDIIISATLGGRFVIDATRVRWLAYDTGSGVVPATDPSGDSPVLSRSGRNILVEYATSTLNRIIYAEGGGGGSDPRIDDILTALGVMGPQLQAISLIETGRWRLVGSQMIYYAADGATPLYRFNLLKADGSPAVGGAGAVDRVPV